MRSCRRTQHRHLRQIGKVKNLDKWVPYELTANNKNCHFEVSSSLILCNIKEPFLSWMVMWWKVAFIWQLWWPAQWLDREGAPKHFPRPTLHQKRVMVTVWWSAACLIHHRFLNPSETTTSEKYAQQINERHWKLQRLQPGLVNRMGPVLLRNDVQPHVAQPVLQKLNELEMRTKVFLIHHIHLTSHKLMTTSASISMKFCRENASTPVGCRKRIPRVCQIPKLGFLQYRNKQTYFLLAKMCWL